ncbi:MAG TPA: sulfurtransferase [Quisquiliibacterium sp.]|nr:sulfurtransferase [Quisquiliibacterium sp.]
MQRFSIARTVATVLTTTAVFLATPAVHASPLVEAQALHARLGGQAPAAGTRIIDIRDGKDEAGKTPYELGHLPGAVHAPYSQWRGPKDNPGKLPELSKLAQLIQRLGLERDTDVVLVYEGKDATDFGAAARVYWTLKTAGLTKLSILNGGMKAWRAAGGAVTTDVPTVQASSYQPTIDTRLVATREEVERAVAGGSAKLLDARPADFFEGDTRHAAAKVPGTIQGAKNVDNAVWFAKGGSALLPAADVKRIAQQHGIAPAAADGPETVSFCNTGHWAATNWFVLSEVLGDRKVKMYPESMVEWSRAGLPMSNVPNRLKQLLIDMKLSSAK